MPIHNARHAALTRELNLGKNVISLKSRGGTGDVSDGTFSGTLTETSPQYSSSKPPRKEPWGGKKLQR